MGWQNVFAAFLQAGNLVVINSNGLFVYNGTPALNNLVASMAPLPGTDSVGNSYLNDITAYAYSSGFATAAQIGAAVGFGVGINLYTAPNMAGPWSLQATCSTDTSGVWTFNANGITFKTPLTINPSSGPAYLVLEQSGAAHLSAPPQAYGDILQTGLANEQEQLNLNSGYTTTVGSPGQATIGLTSRADDSSLASSVTISSDQSSVNLQDGTNYPIGHKVLYGGKPTVSSTTQLPVSGTTTNVAPYAYKFRAIVQFHGSGTTGQSSWNLITSVPHSNAWITGTVTSGASLGSGQQTGNSLGNVIGPTLTTNPCTMIIEAYAQFSGSGTVALGVAITSGGSNWVIDNCVFEVYPLF